MSELYLISCCCFTGKYCSYDSAFVDGYLLGIITILFMFSLVGIVNNLNEKYQYNEDEDKDEPVSNTSDINKDDKDKDVEKSEDDKDEEVEKSEADKKDE